MNSVRARAFVACLTAGFIAGGALAQSPRAPQEALLSQQAALPPHQPALPSQRKTESFKRAIRKLYDLKEKAWAAGDAESIVTKFYSADAISAGEGDQNTLTGREQFRAAYRQYVKDVPTVRIESVRTYVNGNAGWDWANFYSYPKPDKKSLYPPSPIRILFTWARENGRWVCKGDIFVNGKFPKLP